MAGQPPFSPWMDNSYYNPKWQTPRDKNGKRDRAWLDGDLLSIKWTAEASHPLRMLNHWDNFDGTVERGYAGRSIFFEDNNFREDYQLIEEYATLLSSVKLNAICINNVNVREHARFFINKRHGYLPKIKKISDIFAKKNIKTFIAINFAAPKFIGNLATSDPMDEQVIAFWQERCQEIYAEIPNFGGFVVKADAEGEPGPLQYGRTHADGANMLANAIKPFGGLIIWRAFVYNCNTNWRDKTIDRAKAAYENFKPLDGQFLDNVILQIKNGPIDFQLKEPVSPLFGALKHTNQVLELQITQEYTGQQQHICFLAPLWEEIFNEYDTLEFGKITNIMQQTSINKQNYGVVGVNNVGLDYNWCGNKLAQANLYAFARLSYDSTLTAKQIAHEWVALTYTNLDQTDKDKLVDILMQSRDVYRSYTAPLGVGSMMQPGHHYGCNVDGYEYDRWGGYHFANHFGLGVDRTKETGSNFVSQYDEKYCKLYNNPQTCPDADLLFFHHCSYAHILQNGKTIIQYIYDEHFAGVEAVQKFITIIETLQGKLPENDYQNIRERLDEQLNSAIDWRDKINTYFWRKSAIVDIKGRKIYD